MQGALEVLELVLQTTGEAGDATRAAGDALAVEVALVWLEQCQALVRELLPLLELVTGAAARPLAARLEQLYHALQVCEDIKHLRLLYIYSIR